MLSNRMLSRLSQNVSCRPRRVSLVRPRNAVLACPSQSKRFQTSLAFSVNARSGRASLNNGWPSSCSSSLSSIFGLDDDPTLSQQSIQRQQVRWKRKSGASADDPKPRRWSKKQKKRFRRKLERQRELEQHSAPGSKAGKRREYEEETRKEMMDEYQARLDGSYYREKLANSHPLEDPALEYTASDALLDDVVGNPEYKGQPTPEPIYYGDRQRAFFNRVVDQLEVYHEELAAASLPQGKKRKPPKHLLPSDQEIALAIKAYRDQRGTKQKPIGIAKALHHVLKDLRVPSTETCFGEYSYNALLSCCRTPKEGLRVFQMMDEHGHPISKYSWAILMDIHAKVGDFEGCVRVLDEMHAAGHEPNLAAYTSLLAACYKVCNDGRVSHAVRAKAGEVGWEKWQELQINGLDPDVMCYGAILRLCAARGQPERCMNLLEEMPRFDVAPTTLCFSSALKAIAKSHETAIRYQRGWSKVNRRRERITAHHGKMAYDVVLLAEAAKVELDDGFVSALQLCAAAAGDSATAKAIYLASKVQRNMKHWRVIGGDDHLARLRGEDSAPMQQLDNGASMLQLGANSGDTPAAIANANIRKRQQHKALSFGEREYGKDTRTLSAILRACAQASDTRGVGTMWSGRQNYGYLDLTSLRLIQQTRKPSFRNTDVPGISRTAFGIGSMVEIDDLINPRKRTDPYLRKGARKKYPGMITMEGTPEGLHDLPDEDYNKYFDEDGMMRQEYIDTGQYPEYERIQKNERYLAAKEAMLELEQSQEETVEQIETGDISTEQGTTPMYFCDEERRWKMGQPDDKKVMQPIASSVSRRSVLDSHAETEKDEVEWYFDNDTRKWATRPKHESTGIEASPAQENERISDDASDDSNEDATIEDWYFDDDARCWKSRTIPVTPAKVSEDFDASPTEFEARAIDEARKNPGLHDESDAEIDQDSEDEDDDEEIDEEEFAKALMAAQEQMALDGSKFEDAEMENDFAMFFDHLKQEMHESGEDVAAVDEMEVRQLFMVMRNQFEASVDTEFSESEMQELSAETTELDKQESDNAIPTLARGRTPPKQDFNDIMRELKDEWGDDGNELDVDDWSDDELDDDGEETPQVSLTRNGGPSTERQAAVSTSRHEPLESHVMNPNHTTMQVTEGSGERRRQHNVEAESALSMETVYPAMQAEEHLPDAMIDDFELEELKELLPGLPISRLRRVRQAYTENLSDPSLLTLVPILRETMPDWFTSKSLRASNARNAHFVMERAKEAGLLDLHVLNGMLQFYTSAGSIEHALALYEEYDEQKLEPTSYSDRLIVQMFLKQRRLNRCLAFKQKVEERGRNLDLLAYGPIIEHCSKHRQLGSALMFLEECIRVNGAPPGEAYVKQLRILCRQEGVEEEVGLEAMIGEDPIMWKKYGEAVLKPGKAGRSSDINLVRNAMVRA